MNKFTDVPDMIVGTRVEGSMSSRGPCYYNNELVIRRPGFGSQLQHLLTKQLPRKKNSYPNCFIRLLEEEKNMLYMRVLCTSGISIFSELYKDMTTVHWLPLFPSREGS